MQSKHVLFWWKNPIKIWFNRHLTTIKGAFQSQSHWFQIVPWSCESVPVQINFFRKYKITVCFRFLCVCLNIQHIGFSNGEKNKVSQAKGLNLHFQIMQNIWDPIENLTALRPEARYVLKKITPVEFYNVWSFRFPKDWWANNSFTRLECAARRALIDSRTLAFTTRAKRFASLFIGNTLYCVHFCRAYRQWLGAMGIHIVRTLQYQLSRTYAYNHHNHILSSFFICSAKSLRTASNVFVINLAICDFTMMLKTPIFIYNSFNHGYALGSTGCQIFALMGSLSGIGAAITNACIAYDRYSVNSLNIS